jgi:hypothetical protein
LACSAVFFKYEQNGNLCFVTGNVVSRQADRANRNVVVKTQKTHVEFIYVQPICTRFGPPDDGFSENFRVEIPPRNRGDKTPMICKTFDFLFQKTRLFSPKIGPNLLDVHDGVQPGIISTDFPTALFLKSQSNTADWGNSRFL